MLEYTIIFTYRKESNGYHAIMSSYTVESRVFNNFLELSAIQKNHLIQWNLIE